MLSSSRLRTDRTYNLHITGEAECDERGFPTLATPVISGPPPELVGWQDSNRQGVNLQAAVHFFADDYRFEAIWRSPERYVDRLSRFGAVLTPDFSLYRDMPIPMQVWNVYRSRAIGNYWQRMGLHVIPTLQWSTPASYVFALEGLPIGGVYAVSTVGVRASRLSKGLWRSGMRAALDAVQPDHLVLYGGVVDEFDFDVPVTVFESAMARRFSDGWKGSGELGQPERQQGGLRVR